MSSHAACADQTGSDRSTEEEVIASSPTFDQSHEGPEGRGHGAAHDKCVRDTCMDAPAELTEKQRRQARDHRPAPILKQSERGQIEEGESCGEQTVFDEQEAQ